MSRNRNEKTARSFENAIELLLNDSWSPHLGRFRSSYAFRGLSNQEYELKTSLMRLGGPYPALESHLIRNFSKYAQLEPGVHHSEWKWLTIGQHHGLPTRLLDWTYSPFVALHFLTADRANMEKDGAVWCVNYVRCHSELPPRLKQALQAAGSYVFTVGMLEKVTENLVGFDELAGNAFALFFEPPSMDARIVNQFALFSVLSNPRVAIDEWLQKNPHLYRRVVIPARIKWEVRDKLDQANITERVLFPGLDGLASWLHRHYSPSGAAVAAPGIVEAKDSVQPRRIRQSAAGKRRGPTTTSARSRRR